MIITLCGGGSTFTPGIVKSIALRKDELDVDEIRLYDINEERQRKIGVLVDWILHEDLGLDIKLTVTTDKKTAFTDASFVFAQMRVGGYAMREQDEKIPLRHGCVGQETCGCGGLAYGMRTIFPMVELIDDVEKYAKKDYWILNYSNPAAIVSEGCRVLRPNARIINISDRDHRRGLRRARYRQEGCRVRLLWPQPLWLVHLDPPQGRGGAPATARVHQGA